MGGEQEAADGGAMTARWLCRKHWPSHERPGHRRDRAERNQGSAGPWGAGAWAWGRHTSGNASRSPAEKPIVAGAKTLARPQPRTI